MGCASSTAKQTKDDCDSPNKVDSNDPEINVAVGEVYQSESKSDKESNTPRDTPQ